MHGAERLAKNARSERHTTTQRRLIVITALLGILTLGHDVDHVRQGRALPFVLYVVGVGAPVSIATTLVVLIRYPAWSRPVAMAQGITTVVGVGRSTSRRSGPTLPTRTRRPMPMRCRGSSSWP